MSLVPKRWARPQAPSPSSIPTLNEDDSREILREHYSRSLTSAETARARAQVSFTIVSALTTILLGVVAFAGFIDQRIETKASMIFAGALWIAATFLYAQAATGTFASEETRQQGLRVSGEEAPIAAASAVALVRHERDLVRWKARQANATAFIAALCSICAISSLWLLTPPTESVVQVSIKSTEISNLRSICGNRIGLSFPAVVNSADVTKKYITLSGLSKATCRDSSKLTIPVSWVSALSERR